MAALALECRRRAGAELANSSEARVGGRQRSWRRRSGAPRLRNPIASVNLNSSPERELHSRRALAWKTFGRTLSKARRPCRVGWAAYASGCHSIGRRRARTIELARWQDNSGRAARSRNFVVFVASAAGRHRTPERAGAGQPTRAGIKLNLGLLARSLARGGWEKLEVGSCGDSI